MQSIKEEQICCATYKVGDIEVRASLLAAQQGVKHQYSILLEHEGERALCEIGTQVQLAKRMFFNVVFGGVTACTLADVAEDYLAGSSRIAIDDLTE